MEDGALTVLLSGDGIYQVWWWLKHLASSRKDELIPPVSTRQKFSRHRERGSSHKCLSNTSRLLTVTSCYIVMLCSLQEQRETKRVVVKWQGQNYHTGF